MRDNSGDVDEIKEFHFHLYWLTQSKQATANAQELLNMIEAKNLEGYFVAKPLRINVGPVGVELRWLACVVKLIVSALQPHPMSSCEVWVPIEYFGRFYGWVSQVRPADVTLMIHPLSKEAYVDHTHRIAFMGAPAPLSLEGWSKEKADEFPAQYPELGLGYSKKQ
ncbi:UNVERIFIED_CONTAM: hypothetical protein HDU68_003297 [Siphonaria sp. JEL0065]|nr:hypothetical protein HDU68_003297 [Siphonaria sp. JEL0065]